LQTRLNGAARPYSSALRSLGAVALSEGEDVRFDARVEECNLERAVRDRPGLAHQLIEPWVEQRSPALLVDVQWAAPGAAPSTSTRNGTAVPARDRRTRWTSRAWKRKTIRPPASALGRLLAAGQLEISVAMSYELLDAADALATAVSGRADGAVALTL
jgi:hypothetical protein